MSDTDILRRRRDPRLEWMARNRLHPEHSQALATLGLQASGQEPAEWPGPNGLVRRNPHAIGFIGPNGRKRIDRSGAQTGGAAPAARSGDQDKRRLVEIETPAFHIAVVPDTASGRLTAQDRDLFGLARRLADQSSEQQSPEQHAHEQHSHEQRGAVLAVIFGDRVPEGLDEAGADRVILLPVTDAYSPEQRRVALSALEAALTPRHWLLPDTALSGGDLGRRLAISLGERPACGVWRVDLRQDKPQETESVEGAPNSESEWLCLCRSGSGRRDQSRPLPRVVLALAECGEPVVETRHAARLIDPSEVLGTELPTPLARIEDLGAVAVDPAAIALDESEFILSAGNGVRDWEGFHLAAQVLGATEGASRVAVDDGHMPRDRQVGATGTWVSARVYVAVGISGAIQHLQGIQRCDRVVAINADAGCDMVKRADLSVIADSAEVLEALVAQVRALRGEEIEVESRDVA